MEHRAAVCLFGLLVGASGGAARAGGPELGYVYTAETEKAGETEISTWATDRRGKFEADYGAQDYRLEVEHGITNRLQVSGYADFASHHISSANGELPHVDRNFAFKGLETEFVYQLANPDKGVGLAFYRNPVGRGSARSRAQRRTSSRSSLRLSSRRICFLIAWFSQRT